MDSLTPIDLLMKAERRGITYLHCKDPQHAAEHLVYRPATQRAIVDCVNVFTPYILEQVGLDLNETIVLKPSTPVELVNMLAGLDVMATESEKSGPFAILVYEPEYFLGKDWRTFNFSSVLSTTTMIIGYK